MFIPSNVLVWSDNSKYRGDCRLPIVDWGRLFRKFESTGSHGRRGFAANTLFNRHLAIGNPPDLTRMPIDPTIHPDERMIAPAAQTDSLLAWMSSLADMTRLRLLRLLERHELGVVELCDV